MSHETSEGMTPRSAAGLLALIRRLARRIALAQRTPTP